MADLTIIPHGPYCHGVAERGRGPACPYWSMLKELGDDGELHETGYCRYLGVSDAILLWDQVKICGIHDDYDDLPEVDIPPGSLDNL